MTDRERLIEIVKNSLIKHIDKSCCLAENIVDDLLTEKVTFPPVAFSDNRRERMIELLNGYYEETGLAIVHYFTDDESEMLADYILSDGWIRPPCKVGDTVYMPFIESNLKELVPRAVPLVVESVALIKHIPEGTIRTKYRTQYISFKFTDFGSKFFHNESEAFAKAEQALAERQGEAECEQ